MKIKSVLFAVSLVLNAFFILILILASLVKTAPLSFFNPGNGHVTSAAVVSVPPSAGVVFDLIEISMTPGEKAFLQFSFFAAGKQGNLLINALFDHDVISVTHTGYGIEITALTHGSTVMQTLTNDGIKNVAAITVRE